MSTIKDFQVNECKEKDLLAPITICPPCINDPHAPQINWIAQTNPYFDARECEYVSVYRIPIKEVEELEFETLADLGEMYKKEAIRILLRHYNKLENDYTVCAYGGCATAEEYNEAKVALENLKNAIYNSYESLSDKYGLSAISSGTAATVGVSAAGAGAGFLASLGGLAGASAVGGVILGGGGVVLGVGVIAGLIGGLLASNEMASIMEELGEDFPIEDLRDDLLNIIGPNYSAGIAKLYEIFSELHPYALEWVADIGPNDFIIDDANNIKFKLTVPAFNFDLIPEAPDSDTGGQSDGDGANETSFPNEIIIKSENLLEKKMDLLASLQLFRMPYEFFRRIEDGRLIYRDGSRYETFTFKHTYKKMDNFFKYLEEFLVVNKFRFPYQFVFSLGVDVASEIKLVFDNSNPKRPLVLKKIFAKSQYCDFVELKRSTTGTGRHKVFNYFPTPINLLINLEQINSRLLAVDRIEWLDFALEFIYPALKVDYGRNSGTELAENPFADCLGDVDGWLNQNFFGPLTSFFSTYAFNLQQKICDKDFEVISQNDPLRFFLDEEARDELKQSQKEKAEKSIRKEEADKRRKKIKKLQKDGGLVEETDRQRLFREMKEEAEATGNTVLGSFAPGEEIQDTYTLGDTVYYRNTVDAETPTDSHPNIMNDKDYDEDVKEKVDAAKKAIDEQIDKENGFIQLFIQKALDQVEIDETFGALFGGLFEQQNKGKTPQESLSFWEQGLAAIGLCGFKGISTQAIRCISKGISLEDFQKQVIEKFLRSMPLDNWTVLLAGLPADKVLEIEAAIVEDLGESFKPPWLEQKGQRKKVIKDPEEQRKAKELTVSTLIKKYNKIVDSYTSGGGDTQKNLKTVAKLYLDTAMYRDNTNNFLPAERWGRDDDGTGINNFRKILNKYSRNPNDKVKSINLTNISNLIIDAYIEAMISAIETNTLMQALRQLPGAGIVLTILNTISPGCEGRAQRELGDILRDLQPSDGFIESFSLDICNPHGTFISFNPPEFNGSIDFHKFIVDILGETIQVTVFEIIKQIILSILKTLDGVLCRGLEALGQAALNALTGQENPLQGVFKDVFCPDLSQEESNDQLNKLLDSVGISDRAGPSGPSDIAACLGNAIAGSVTKNDLIAVMTSNQQPEYILENIASSIQLNCPELADVLGAAPQVGALFENIGSLLNPQTILALQNAAETEPDQILSDTICFTAEELSEYQNIIQDTYNNLGLPGSEIVQQQYNSDLDNLSDALDNLIGGGPNDPNKILEDLLNSPYEKCLATPTQSNLAGRLMRDSDISVGLQNEIADIIFNQLNNIFARDLIQGDRALLSKILSDTEGVSFSRHSFLTSNFFFGTFYHNSVEAAEETGGLLADLNPFSFGDRGFFPETIGLYLKEQLLQEITFKKDGVIEALNQGNYELMYTLYEMEENRENYISIYEGSKDDMSYSLYWKSGVYEYLIEGKVNNINSLRGDYQEFLQPDANKTFREKTTNAILKKAISPFGNFMKENNNIYFDVSEKMFNSTKKLILGGDAVSNGFSFGFVQENITEEDMRYVAPDGSEYDFSETDRVLGRSATNNPRVHFLNPDTYGGTYRKPPVYVEPQDFNGWLDIVSNMVPEIDNCEPKRQNIFRGSEIADHCNAVKNSEPNDERLSLPNTAKCFEERPFDKIATSSCKGGLAATCKAFIRTFAIENVIYSLPILMNLEFNNRNFDNSFQQFLVKKFKNTIMNIRQPFLIAGLSKLWKENLYLFILEQVVVDYQRKLDSGEAEPTEEILAALSRISKAEDKYSGIFNTLQGMKGKITYPAPTEDYIENFDFENYDKEQFIVYSQAYQKDKEDLFKETEPYTLSSLDLLSIFTPNQTLMDTRIFMIRIVQKECELILGDLIRQEIKDTIDHMFAASKPEILSLDMFSLTNKDIFSNTNLEGIGTNSYEEKLANNETVVLGDVPSVTTDMESSSPFDGSGNEIIIEKYIRVIDKEGLEIPIISDRDYTLRGVTSVEEFDQFIKNLPEDMQDKYLSELFGDSELLYSVSLGDIIDNNINLSQLVSNSIELTPQQYIVMSGMGPYLNPSEEVLRSTLLVNEAIIEQLEGEYDPVSFRGEIGLKYGIRICLNPKISDINTSFIPNQEQIDLAKREKTFLHNQSNFPQPNCYSIPICSAEVDFIDHKISEFSLDNGVYRFDLDCLLRKLIKTEEYQDFFVELFNKRVLSSTLAIYSNLFFLPSIGPSDGWNEDVDFISGFIGFRAFYPDGDEYYFGRTYEFIRKIFAMFYESNDFSSTEKQITSGNLERISAAFFRNPFRGLIAKHIQDKLKVNQENIFAKKHRVYNNRPFDKDGQQCEDPYDKIFS